MMRFYVTTPIYYVSDVPHLGHAYTTVVCDALARYHRLRGQPTRFLTGTDDHGQKIARLAEAKGTTPRAYADQFADAYRTTWQKLEISNDDFIRTTDADHEATVQRLWSAMEKNGYIYEGEYEGWYCVPCEQFYTEKELTAGNKCPVHEKPVDRLKEKSFYFKLSAFQDRLLEHFAQHPEFIQPEMRRNEVTAFVKSGLQDLSISRTTFKWGVPVPNHDKHIIYVWLDALCNYYSATRRSDEAKRFWDDPESNIVHVIGKEISRFHAVFWPAFLMAAEWRLPTTVFAHGWWTVNGQKMSKTLGNVVDPVALSEDIGVDAFRYFVLREVPLGADGDFSHEALLTRYNAELANDLGNLLNRTLGMVAKYGLTSLRETPDPLPELMGARDGVATAMEAFAPSVALQNLFNLVRAANTYIDKQAPWGASPSSGVRILVTVLEALRFLGNLLEPFMPERAAELRRQIGQPGPASWPHYAGEHGAVRRREGRAAVSAHRRRSQEGAVGKVGAAEKGRGERPADLVRRVSKARPASGARGHRRGGPQGQEAAQARGRPGRRRAPSGGSRHCRDLPPRGADRKKSDLAGEPEAGDHPRGRIAGHDLGGRRGRGAGALRARPRRPRRNQDSLIR